MAWPLSRIATFTPGSKWLSSVANALQDAIIGDKHGQITEWFPVPPARVETSIALNGGSGLLSATADAAVLDYAPIPIREGTTILSPQARARSHWYSCFAGIRTRLAAET